MYGILPPQNQNAKTTTKTVGQNITKKTLDVQHTIKMQQFMEKDDTELKLTTQINKLKEEFEKLNEKKRTISQDDEIDDSLINRMIELKDNIMLLEKQLKILENTDEVDYLINTGDILFQYYEIVDKGSSQEESLIVNKKTINENSILKYLLKSSKDVASSPPVEENVPKKDKASLLEKYMEFTEQNYVKNNVEKCQQSDKCSFCESQNRNIMLNDGIIYCNDCFTVEYIIIDHDRPSYKDPPKEISYFAYKRINHFNESYINNLIRTFGFQAKKLIMIFICLSC